MNQHNEQMTGIKKLNNAGSAMIMALTVIALISILGTMALSSALLNVKLREMNRKSDKNFYYLEIALDEIYAQTGRMAGNMLRDNYVQVMDNLYKEGFKTNDEANIWLKKGFVEALAGEDGFNLVLSGTEGSQEESRENAAKKLKSFSDTIEEQSLAVSVDSVILETEEPIAADDGDVFPLTGEEKVYTGLTLKGLRLVYRNPEDGTESALTVDLKIKAPYVRFINEGDALLDYVLAANGGIDVNVNGTGNTVNHFVGNIYGDSITISHSVAEMESGLIAAAGSLTVDRGGELTVWPGAASDAQSRIWADGILVNFASTLKADNASIFVKDDLTLSGDNNSVTLSGSYYGYGNEGDNRKLKKETPDKSSAVIISGRGSRVDMTGLYSLLLAGRAYMRFDNTITDGRYVYPMGESLAVKATQTIYLIPESAVTLLWNGKTEAAGSNPVILPKEEDGYELTLKIQLSPENGGGIAEYLIQVENPAAEDDAGKGIHIFGPEPEESPVVPVIFNGKVYLYHNFESEGERRRYFTNYLEENASSFDALLEKSKITGFGAEPDSGGIYITDEDSGIQINTSGALYQVAGSDGTGDSHLFQLLETGEDGVGSSIQWINLAANLDASFKNLQRNMAETDRVGVRAAEAGSGFDFVLPVGNYVRLNEVAKLSGEPVYLEQDGCGVLLSGDSVMVELNGDGKATAEVNGKTYSMAGGLIVTSGDISVVGDGAFSGLLMSGGKIAVLGNADLTADGQTYEPLLQREEVSGYFYDYSDVAFTVTDDYKDFVLLENWSRSGREKEAQIDE